MKDAPTVSTREYKTGKKWAGASEPGGYGRDISCLWIPRTDKVQEPPWGRLLACFTVGLDKHHKTGCSEIENPFTHSPKLHYCTVWWIFLHQLASNSRLFEVLSSVDSRAFKTPFWLRVCDDLGRNMRGKMHLCIRVFSRAKNQTACSVQFPVHNAFAEMSASSGNNVFDGRSSGEGTNQPCYVTASSRRGCFAAFVRCEKLNESNWRLYGPSSSRTRPAWPR